MYKRLIKPILFLSPPEKVHHSVFRLIKFCCQLPFVSALLRSVYVVNDKRLERTVFGITFPNPVGLAAGFDKDAKLFDELACFGFGSIEIGTLTPVAQPGNPKPRMFRLPIDEALINRMGFNNGGVQQAAQRLTKRKSKVIVGGNIGKNKLTDNEDAASDYEKCFETLFPYVDYFVVNVSSPNTPNLRELQDKEPLTKLLLRVKLLNIQLANKYAALANNPKQQKLNQKPILLKIAPDLTNQQLNDIVEIVNNTKIDGVIATNTTISRNGLHTYASELAFIGVGGLSGKPLAARATEVVRYLSQQSKGSFPIIAVGGIHSAADAIEKLNAGASLVQVYTGFIYEGPSLIKKINKGILKNQLV